MHSEILNLINTLPYPTVSLSQSQTLFLNTKHYKELISATYYCPLLITIHSAHNFSSISTLWHQQLEAFGLPRAPQWRKVL